AMALLRLGEIAENSKDASVALARYDEALRLALQFGKGQVGSAIGYARLQLGTLQFREGQREKADDQRRKLLQEALRNLAAVIADPPAGLNLSRPYYFMAEAKYSLGLKQEAVADYESGLRFDVDNELADALWSGVAWAKRDLGDASGAMEACRKVIDGFPASSYRPDALTLMAALRRAGGDTDGALADLELFLAEYQDHPQTARGDLERAAILGETGKYAEAAAAFQRFLDKYPSHPDVPQALYQRSWALWNRLGPRIAEAREAEVRWRELTDGRETAKLPENERIEASRAEQRKNDLAAEVAKSEDEILAAFRDLIERHPDYPVVDAAWLRIGEILYDRGDYQQAMAAYQKSLSLAAAKNGDLADKAQYRLAWSIQRLAESAEHLSMTAPDQTGREAARKEMWDRRVAAIDAFEVIIGRYPRSDLVGDACFRAAELRRRSGQDNTDPARRTAWFQSAAQRYRQALEKGGQSAPYRVAAEYGEGMCYLLDDKSTQAREVFRRLLLNPDSPYVQEAYWGLGQANLNLGAYSDATSAFEQAVAIDRTTETAAKSRYGLGITAAMSRDNVKARLEFLAVDALYPNYPEWAAAALVRAARAAIAEGMKDRAIGDLERVLARYPDTPAAVEARDLQASVMLN
ncbi:MAG: tetratricopeptide repeat protein, partial [Planctomycetes bacterium]|nr:tetratricopeptide repeat protein [Planctomycetota bacterium]